MALTDDNMVMPVAPMYGSGYGNGGLFGGNGDSWLGILFLIALCNGGWGGFGGFGGGFGAMMGMDGFGLYPWLNNSQNINDGFRSQGIATQVNGIQNAITSGFGDVQTALCGGFKDHERNLKLWRYHLYGDAAIFCNYAHIFMFVFGDFFVDKRTKL